MLCHAFHNDHNKYKLNFHRKKPLAGSFGEVEHKD